MYTEEQIAAALAAGMTVEDYVAQQDAAATETPAEEVVAEATPAEETPAA